MAALRENFTLRARREGAELRLLAERIGEDDLVRVEIRKIVHGLAGAAAIFGMPTVSSQAADLEEAIVSGAAQDDIALSSLSLADRLASLGAGRTA